ncbi:hypothetical protein C8Q76DRAFT_790502 [Earliella scabrosa]|nr:hypothetical protein C8Q76DRAFT_790502 [Earliella scabrosa]
MPPARCIRFKSPSGAARNTSRILTSSPALNHIPKTARRILDGFYRNISTQPNHEQLDDLREQISHIPGCEACTVSRLRMYYTKKRLVHTGKSRTRRKGCATLSSRPIRPRRVRSPQLTALANTIHAALTAPPLPDEHVPKTFVELSAWLAEESAISNAFLESLEAGAYAHFGLFAVEPQTAPPQPFSSRIPASLTDEIGTQC